MLDIENIVFTRVKAKMPQSIKDKYPKMRFTTSDTSSSTPQFPTVYIHMLESSEVGEDFEGTDINGINASFQIEVSDNQSQARAKEVMDEVVLTMKSMRFRAVGMPFFSNTSGTYRSITRYRRKIGSNDIL